ncbi:hypothetical protein HDU93_009163 [Gonapodya sp. JEL0774]|nr:hypothetical protein HDU93_009163 [Gonapodya sp. JEL0774]
MPLLRTLLFAVMQYNCAPNSITQKVPKVVLYPETGLKLHPIQFGASTLESEFAVELELVKEMDQVLQQHAVKIAAQVARWRVERGNRIDGSVVSTDGNEVARGSKTAIDRAVIGGSTTGNSAISHDGVGLTHAQTICLAFCSQDAASFSPLWFSPSSLSHSRYLCGVPLYQPRYHRGTDRPREDQSEIGTLELDLPAVIAGMVAAHTARTVGLTERLDGGGGLSLIGDGSGVRCEVALSGGGAGETETAAVAAAAAVLNRLDLSDAKNELRKAGKRREGTMVHSFLNLPDKIDARRYRGLPNLHPTPPPPIARRVVLLSPSNTLSAVPWGMRKAHLEWSGEWSGLGYGDDDGKETEKAARAFGRASVKELETAVADFSTHAILYVTRSLHRAETEDVVGHVMDMNSRLPLTIAQSTTDREGRSELDSEAGWVLADIQHLVNDMVVGNVDGGKVERSTASGLGNCVRVPPTATTPGCFLALLVREKYRDRFFNLTARDDLLTAGDGSGDREFDPDNRDREGGENITPSDPIKSPRRRRRRRGSSLSAPTRRAIESQSGDTDHSGLVARAASMPTLSVLGLGDRGFRTGLDVWKHAAGGGASPRPVGLEVMGTAISWPHGLGERSGDGDGTPIQRRKERKRVEERWSYPVPNPKVWK